MKTIMQEFIDILEVKLLLNNQKIIYHIDVDYFLRKEKEQIIDAWIKGNYKSNADMIWKKALAEQYYNETFKN